MELPFCHICGTQNFEEAPRFLENLWNPAICYSNKSTEEEVITIPTTCFNPSYIPEKVGINKK
jgi:hypothetical protein